MIDALLKDVASPEDEDALVRIQRVTWGDDDDVRLDLAVIDDHAVTLSEWAVTCRGVRECVIGGRFGALSVQVESRHAAIWQYRDPWRALFFRGRPADVDGLVGRLWAEHRRLAGMWIPFERYLNSSVALHDLLAGGYGKLAEGPNFLIEKYAQVLEGMSVEPGLGDMRPPAEPVAELSLLTVDTTYIVAETFDEARR